MCLKALLTLKFHEHFFFRCEIEKFTLNKPVAAIDAYLKFVFSLLLSNAIRWMNFEGVFICCADIIELLYVWNIRIDGHMQVVHIVECWIGDTDIAMFINKWWQRQQSKHQMQ